MDNPVLTGLLVGQTVVDGIFGPQEQQAAFANGHAQAQAAANSTRINLETQILALQKRLNETYRALVAEQALAHGQAAMLDAYRNQHPDSPLRRDSGERYKDGRMKTAGRLIFEKAHDAHIAQYGARVGIADPTEVRAD